MAKVMVPISLLTTFFRALMLFRLFLVNVKDWLNWTVYFGSFELCNLWYPTLLSCVTVVISLYRGPSRARPNVFGVLACGFFVSFVFCWVYIDAFMYLVRESAVIY